MKRIVYYLLMMFAFISCDVEQQYIIEEEIQEIVKNKEFNPIVLTRSQENMTRNVNDLGFDVFREILANHSESMGKDIMISPFSLSSALSMTANGAVGETKEQMFALLGYEDYSLDEMNTYYSLLIDALVKADEKVDLFSANSIWYVQSIKLFDSYKENVEKVFDASIEEVTSFADLNVMERINEWCSDKTNGMISVFLERPESSSRVKLINALYFNGEWTNKFPKPYRKNFKHEMGSISEKNTLVKTAIYKYIENEDFQCVEIPYGNGAFVMDVILPNADLTMSQAGQRLNGGLWDDLSSSLAENVVSLQIPTFKMEYDRDMVSILMELGMVAPFLNADFSNMCEATMSISKIIQKTSINVTEKGTAASSVTDVTLNDIASPDGVEGQKIKTFIADRPFFYLIRESSTGVILFLGKKA